MIVCFVDDRGLSCVQDDCLFCRCRGLSCVQGVLLG